MEITKEQLDKFINGFKKPKETKARRKTKPCRIKVMGEFITTHSGKTIWGCKGHAKNALTNNCYGLRSRMELVAYEEEQAASIKENRNHDYGKYKNIWQNFVAELESRGILEFVEIDE